jgi:cysteine-rich repeat protein
MNNPSKYLYILAAVFIAEASVLSAIFVINNVAVTAQINTVGNGFSSPCYDDNGLPFNCEDGSSTGGSSSRPSEYDDDDDYYNETGSGYCGNGQIDDREECDEGDRNGDQNSYCSSCCITKPIGDSRNNYCSCGNGDREWPEQCDDGKERNGNSDSLCNMYCKVIVRCGNGVQDKDEECDDGNADNSDACTNECRRPECGDGITQAYQGEECDDGNRDDNDGCNHDCRHEECGDGEKQNNEECDKGSENNDYNECRSDCTKSFCGDGFKQEIMGEECDDASANGSSASLCTNDCKVKQVFQPVDRCGDGNTTGNEECDDGNSDNTDTCTSTCRNARCGDDYIQVSRNEQCDEGVLNGAEISGQVRCTTSCTYPVADNDDDGETPPSLPPVDDDDDGSTTTTNTNSSAANTNGQQVRPAAPTTQPTNLDDLRHKKEEQEKKLREAMRKAREKAAKQAQNDQDDQDDQDNDNDNDNDNGDGDDGESIVETVNEDGLHCFDSAGNIVNDRSRCDRGQEQYLFNRQNVSDEEVRKELSHKLLGDNATEEKRMHLLKSLGNARTRMDKIYASGNFDGEVQQYFEASIEWLDRGVTYFSTGDRNLEEIQQMAEPVRQLVEQASSLVQQKHNLPSTRPDISPIVVKTERLVMKFRESFIALAQAKVELDRDALEQYIEAANLFANVKTLCLEDSGQCTRINDVLDILKNVQGPLQKQLENNPEVYKRVQEKFEE